MQVVTLFNLTHVLLHLLNTMSETILSNSLIFQEFAKLKYMPNLKISKSQNLTYTKISRPKVYDLTKIPFLKRLIGISRLIGEVINDQNLLTELDLANWFSSYVQFCSGSHFLERAEAVQ